MRRTTPSKGAKAKADKWFSLIVRSAGACAACGQADYSKLQCAHIISRRFSNTRCHLPNAVALCAKCHHHFTDHPIEWASWVLERIGQSEYQRLYALSQSSAKVDWVEVAAELAALAKNLGVAA